MEPTLGRTDGVPALETQASKLSLKRKRLTTSQRKKIRRLLADKVEYELALKRVLETPAETRPNEMTEAVKAGPTARTQPAKKARLTDADANCITKVGIVCAKFPLVQMNNEQLKKVEAAIIREVRNVPEGTVGPRFAGCLQRPGWLLVNCHNEASRNWLSVAVSKLKPWEGAELRTVEGNDMPKLCVSALFPDGKLDAEVVLRTLRVQNPELHTENWKVVNCKAAREGVIYTFEVDDLSTQALEKLDNRPFFDMGRVTFKVMASPGKQGEPEKVVSAVSRALSAVPAVIVGAATVPVQETVKTPVPSTNSAARGRQFRQNRLSNRRGNTAVKNLKLPYETRSSKRRGLHTNAPTSK